MKKEKVDKKPFIIILSIAIILTIITLLVEKGSVVLNESKYKNLDKIVINAEYSDVEVKFLDSEYTSVQIYGKKDDSLSVTEISNVLRINKTSTKAFCLFNCSDKVILYLPREFNTLDISLELGDVEVNDTIIDEVYIHNAIGNIKLDKIKFCDITLDIGDIKINEIDGIKDSYIKVGTGDIEVKKTLNFNLFGKSDVGEVKLKDIKDQKYYLNVETNIGDINIK